MATWRPTMAAGNGARPPAPMRYPGFACSIRSPSPSASIHKGALSSSGYRSCANWTGTTSMIHHPCPAPCAATRHRWWTWRTAERGPWRLSRICHRLYLSWDKRRWRGGSRVAPTAPVLHSLDGLEDIHREIDEDANFVAVTDGFLGIAGNTQRGTTQTHAHIFGGPALNNIFELVENLTLSTATVSAQVDLSTTDIGNLIA